MQDSRVGQRYARALFRTALENNVVEAVEADLEAIVSLLHNNAEFRRFVLSPNVGRQEKLKIADKVLSDRVTALTMRALRLLLEKRREEEIESVQKEFVELRRDHDRIYHAIITTSEHLEEDQRAKVVAKLEQVTGRKIEPDFQIDPHLIGGIHVEYENFLLDSSLRGELRRLKERLLLDVLKQS